MKEMRFFSLLSFCVPFLCFPTNFAFAEAGDASLASNAVADAKERFRRAELLSISEELRGIYADFEKNEVPDLERSRRMAPIAARYENLLAQFPNDAETLVLYAKFLRDGGDDDGARECFEKAQKIEPGWAVVYQQLAAIAAEQGDAAKAFPLMKKAVELESGQAVYHLQLGSLIRVFADVLTEHKLFETREEADRAMQNAFRAAYAIDPTPETAWLYAESFSHVENPDWRAALEAWNAVEKIICKFSRNGTDSAAIIFMKQKIDLRRACVYCELGKFGEAEAVLGKIEDGQLASECEQVRKLISEKRKHSSEE